MKSESDYILAMLQSLQGLDCDRTLQEQGAARLAGKADRVQRGDMAHRSGGPMSDTVDRVLARRSPQERFQGTPVPPKA